MTLCAEGSAFVFSGDEKCFSTTMWLMAANARDDLCLLRVGRIDDSADGVPILRVPAPLIVQS